MSDVRIKTYGCKELRLERGGLVLWLEQVCRFYFWFLLVFPGVASTKTTEIEFRPAQICYIYNSEGEIVVKVDNLWCLMADLDQS